MSPSIFTFVLSFLKSMSVEPILLLAGISFNIHSLIQDIGLIRILCDRLFNANEGTSLNNHTSFQCWDPSPLGAGLGANGTEWWYDAEIDIQRGTTTISMISTMSYLLPSCVANLVISAYGDRHGRKGVLLLGLFGIMIIFVPTPFLFAWPQTTPIYIAFILTAVAAFTGAIGNIMSSSAAYLSDTIDDRETITIRITILHMCFTVASVSGPLIGNALLNTTGYVWSSLVAFLIASVAFLCAVFTVKQVKPRNKKPVGNRESAIPEKQDQKMAKVEEGAGPHCDEDSKGGMCLEIKEIISSIPQLLKEMWFTIAKRREGRKRTYLIVLACIGFMVTASEASIHGTIFALFVQKEPLSISKDEISYYRSMSSLIRLGGTAGGIYVLKKRIGAPDLLIILLSIASLIGKAILIIFSSSVWMLYVAAGVGALDSLMGPCSQAFVTKIVEPDEVGKVYGVFHFVSSLSFLYTGVGAAAIYQATVAFHPTLVFEIAATMASASLFLVAWLHLDHRRERGREK